MFVKFKKWLKQFFLINDSPVKIAGGTALGIFLGIIPGEGILSTVFFSWLFRLNRLSALAGVAATNMWMTAVILPPSAAVGGFLFHENTAKLIDNFNKEVRLGWEYFLSETVFFNLLLPLMVGFLIVAGAISLAFFFLLYFLLKYEKISFK